MVNLLTDTIDTAGTLLTVVGLLQYDFYFIAVGLACFIFSFGFRLAYDQRINKYIQKIRQQVKP